MAEAENAWVLPSHELAAAGAVAPQPMNACTPAPPHHSCPAPLDIALRCSDALASLARGLEFERFCRAAHSQGAPPRRHGHRGRVRCEAV